MAAGYPQTYHNVKSPTGFYTANTLSSLVNCKRIRIASTMMVKSFDKSNGVFAPYENLSKRAQVAICRMVKEDVEELLKESKKPEYQSKNILKMRSKAKMAKDQNILDPLLQPTFPYVFDATYKDGSEDILRDLEGEHATKQLCEIFTFVFL